MMIRSLLLEGLAKDGLWEGEKPKEQFSSQKQPKKYKKGKTGSSMKGSKFNCWFCGKHVDTFHPDKHPYFRSVTHDIYMHLECAEKYEKLLGEGKIKPYQNGPRKV
jgi:hypothetical protein